MSGRGPKKEEMNHKKRLPQIEIAHRARKEQLAFRPQIMQSSNGHATTKSSPAYQLWRDFMELHFAFAPGSGQTSTPALHPRFELSK